MHIVDSTPLLLQDIEADSAREVDIRVVDGCLEEDSRRSERVRGGELERELEVQAGVWCLGWAFNGGGPVEQIGVVGEGGDAGRGRHHEVHQLGLQPVVHGVSVRFLC